MITLSFGLLLLVAAVCFIGGMLFAFIIKGGYTE